MVNILQDLEKKTKEFTEITVLAVNIKYIDPSRRFSRQLPMRQWEKYINKFKTVHFSFSIYTLSKSKRKHLLNFTVSWLMWYFHFYLSNDFSVHFYFHNKF